MATLQNGQLDYWESSRRPWASLLFIAPLLIVYEVSLISESVYAPAVRNGADIWVRYALRESGIRWEGLLPWMVPIILLGWHFWRRDSGEYRYETIAGMVSESVLWALLLLLLGQLSHQLLPLQIESHPSASPMQRAIAFLGAGIYEEVLFRLALMPTLYLALRCLLVRHQVAIIIAVGVTSLVFAAAHYVESADDLLSLSGLATALWHAVVTPALRFGFGFRLLAGLTFAALFWVRGFGITVGTHVAYDVLVGVILGGMSPESES